jgi:hypothetical protein
LIVFPALLKVHHDPGFECRPEKAFYLTNITKKIMFFKFQHRTNKNMNSWEKNSEFLLQASDI